MNTCGMETCIVGNHANNLLKKHMTLKRNNALSLKLGIIYFMSHGLLWLDLGIGVFFLLLKQW